MRTSLIVDCHNLYVGCNKKFPGKAVNYYDMVSSLEGCGNTLFHKIAYGKQPVHEVRAFATMLERQGFQLHFHNQPYNVHMALRAADLINRRAIDQLVLATAYPEVQHIIRYAVDMGVYVKVLGFDIPPALGRFAEVFELEESSLIERTPEEK